MPLRAWRFERHVNASSTTPAAVIRDSYYHSPAAADARRAGLRDEKRRGDDPLPRQCWNVRCVVHPARDSNRFRLGAPQRPTGFGPVFDLTLIVPRTWAIRRTESCAHSRNGRLADTSETSSRS